MGRTAVTAIALGTIAALIALNHLAFARWLGVDYFGWYVANGAQIGFLSSLHGLVWGSLDRNTGVVSAHPALYGAAALHVVGLPINALGSGFGLRGDARDAGARFDVILAVAIGLLLALALCAWLLVIAPLQYVAFLVFGAPARAAMRSSERPIARFTDGILEMKDIGRGDKVPEGWWDTSLGQRPFAFTSLVQGLGFFVWKLLGG